RVAEEVPDVDDVPPEELAAVWLGTRVLALLDERSVRPLDPDVVAFEHGDVSCAVDRVETRARLSRLDAHLDARPGAFGAPLPAKERAADREPRFDRLRSAPPLLAAVRVEQAPRETLGHQERTLAGGCSWATCSERPSG